METTSNTRPTATRGRRLFTIGLYALLPIAAVVFYGQAAIEPVTITVRGKCPGAGCVRTLTMVEPIVLETLEVSAAALALVLLITGIVALCRRARLQGALALLLALVAYPASCLATVSPTRWGSWGYTTESGAPEGKRHVLVGHTWLESILYLSEPWSKGTWTRSTKVLATGQHHTGENAVPIVRPIGRKQTKHLQLIRCGDTLLGLSKSRVSVAYDTKRKKPYWSEILYTLSPFICLKAGDSLDPADKKAFIEWVEWECKHPDTLGGTPALLATLTRATKHPNAEVRALASSQIKCLKESLARAQE